MLPSVVQLNLHFLTLTYKKSNTIIQFHLQFEVENYNAIWH